MKAALVVFLAMLVIAAESLRIPDPASSRGCQPDQAWDNFRTTWTPPGREALGFNSQPRTLEELEATAAFTKLDSCGESSMFAGNRYIPNNRSVDMVLIFDVNGYVAGMQSVVPKIRTEDDKYYKYSTSPMYNLDTINGEEVYLATVYFVDPDIICSCGRTEDDFKEQGTGHKLIFQNGPTPSVENLHEAPLKRADAKDPWYEHQCVNTMGTHYVRYSPADELNFRCEEDTFPANLLYHPGRGSLACLQWVHVALLEGEGWERPAVQDLPLFISNAPACTRQLFADPGMSFMHVFFVDHKTLICPK